MLAAVVLVVALTCRVTVIYDTAPQTTVNEAGETVEVAKLTVPQQYCVQNWETKMLPTIAEKAVDGLTALNAAKADLAAAGAQYATRENETSAWNFCLTGKARVLSVENPEKKSKARLVVDCEPCDGAEDMKIQVSSVIKTNAVRDAVGFLHLDDFANQVEFAELTKAFNARIQQDLITNLDIPGLEGKEIEYLGCVAVATSGLNSADDALLIPVRLTEVT